MRIVGGEYRGRTLVEFNGQDIRPTSDMVRESLFNIIRFKIQGAKFLDLFCGTGAVGIEALSRGAEGVVFNDFSRESIKVLQKNLEKIKVDKKYKISEKDAIMFLSSATEKFDFIFIDAPYKSELGESAVNLCFNALTDDGIVIYENEKDFSGEHKNLEIYDTRKYGRAHLTFFRKIKV